MKVYQKLASLAEACHKCRKSSNPEWEEKHKEAIWAICNEYLPKGSGFDAGTQINIHKSSEQQLLIQTSFHAMDENGHYAGWIYLEVIVSPNLAWGFDLMVSELHDNTDLYTWDYDKNKTINVSAEEIGLISYMMDTMDDALRQDIPA